MIGVVKAYTTRVGEGPFPTELFGDMGNRLRETGSEYGAVTGRPRRCGWFDAVAVRYAARINGLDGLALTKLDVLDGLDRIDVCTSYRCNGRTLTEFPVGSRPAGAVRARLRIDARLVEADQRRARVRPTAGRREELHREARGRSAACARPLYRPDPKGTTPSSGTQSLLQIAGSHLRLLLLVSRSERIDRFFVGVDELEAGAVARAHLRRNLE